MGLESATKISQLNPLWPLGTDPKSAGDDHIRMIKSCLQAVDGGALTGITVRTLGGTGSYTKPAGLKFVEVTIIGAGGGTAPVPATAAGQSAGATGAGGGGATVKLLTAADLGAPVSYATGAAGTASGTAGGATTFGGLSAGGGGAGGAVGAAATWGLVTGGAGGAGSGGDANYTGGQGGMGGRTNDGAGALPIGKGGSGGSSLQVAAQPEVWINTGMAAANGLSPGGGARGGCSGASQGGQVGGGGANGLIRVMEYF